MRIDLCAYSGYKVYPGRGRTLVRPDGKVFKFLDNRCHKAHLLRRNPRKVTWTVLYRRKHKKGIEEETAKKRTKRTQKFQRAVVGATLQDILAKRNQKPEVRKAQREQAIRAAKDAKKSSRSTTKKPASAAAPAKAKAAKPAQKTSKPMQKAAPRVGGKR
eukprot:maker-scaffold631_size122145-snap-gene-0.34 protein:Tk01055 transcript:maker-scaffold631_size122145-snap-gene-0.34-mRNA-1 annotation:"60s ribosomal protein l24"